MRYYIFYLEKQSTLVLNKQEMTDGISNVLILEEKKLTGELVSSIKQLSDWEAVQPTIVLESFYKYLPYCTAKVYPGKSTNIRYLFFWIC